MLKREKQRCKELYLRRQETKFEKEWIEEMVFDSLADIVSKYFEGLVGKRFPDISD